MLSEYLHQSHFIIIVLSPFSPYVTSIPSLIQPPSSLSLHFAFLPSPSSSPFTRPPKHVPMASQSNLIFPHDTHPMSYLFPVAAVPPKTYILPSFIYVTNVSLLPASVAEKLTWHESRKKRERERYTNSPQFSLSTLRYLKHVILSKPLYISLFFRFFYQYLEGEIYKIKIIPY